MSDKKDERQKRLFVAVLMLVILGLGVASYFAFLANREIIKNTIDLEVKIFDLENQNIFLTKKLQTEEEKNNTFASQIGEIAGTVGKLDKLSKTDEEILQKYSKIYFLNENYIPKGLFEIPSQYVYGKGKTIKILASTSPFLLEMIETAKKDNINLLIISGFRSFDEQGGLKENYKMTYGSGANKFSADQGYSEHQLGTTVDFTSLELGASFVSFGKSKEYQWLLENAYKYGFILSYPESNTYYQYEPWHWRFVGKSLAGRLHEEKQNFYDMSQRQIDAYLINIFD